MKHTKRYVAITLAVVILVCCFASTTAFAKAAKWNIVETAAESIMDAAVEVVPEIADSPTIPTIDTKSSNSNTSREISVTDPVNIYNASIDSVVDNAAIYYYSTTPWYYLPNALGYAASSQNSGDYVQGLMDVAFIIPGSMAGTFTAALERSLVTTALDYAEDGIASAQTIDEYISSIPVAGALYEATGDFGKLAVYSVTLTGINASNTALLLVVQGVVNIATVIMIPITAAAIPFLTLEDGDVIIPRVIGELENIYNMYK